jgi:cell division protease FtsH
LGRDLVKEKDYSEETARIVDEEIKHIIDDCYSRAKKIIQDNKDKLTQVAKALLDKEVLDAEEVKRLIGFKDENNPLPDK